MSQDQTPQTKESDQILVQFHKGLNELITLFERTQEGKPPRQGVLRELDLCAHEFLEGLRAARDLLQSAYLTTDDFLKRNRGQVVLKETNLAESECLHADLDDAQCLDCGTDLTERLSAEAYDRAKATRYGGDY